MNSKRIIAYRQKVIECKDIIERCKDHIPPLQYKKWIKEFADIDGDLDALEEESKQIEENIKKDKDEALDSYNDKKMSTQELNLIMRSLSKIEKKFNDIYQDEDL